MTARERLKDNQKFSELAAIEPRLWDLAEEIAAVRATGSWFCANARWYGYGKWWLQGFKERMCALVGYARKDGPEQLRTSDAYGVVYEALYPLLPSCRDCGCM